MSVLSSIFDVDPSTPSTSDTLVATTSATTSILNPTTSSTPSTSSTATSPISTSLTTATGTTSSTSSLATTSSSSSSSALTIPTSLTTQTTTTNTLTLTTSFQVSTQLGGSTHTVTVIDSATRPSTTAAASNSGGSSSSFWNNEGAVVCTFTAVAVVGAIIIIWAIAFCLRKRWANQYDLESEEAAAEAARAANATAPMFFDDKHVTSNSNATKGTGSSYGVVYDGGAYTVSSASSHGTFAQPLMSTENYSRAEFGSPNYIPSSAFIPPGQAPQHNNYLDYDYHPVERQNSPMMQAIRPLSSYSVPDMLDHHSGLGAEAGGSAGHSTATSSSHSLINGLSRAESQGSHRLLASSPSITDVGPLVRGESYAAHYQPGYSGMAAPGTITDDLALRVSAITAYNEGDGEEDEEEPVQRKVLKVCVFLHAFLSFRQSLKYF
ncbi:hypothetical protein BDP27DRAFT_1419406 [Rhodocollybia butyracea]|uniref:Uncharacterized protein n=1 Tax=Rhodocollybia butyracea TaxID=206335 RepID=A0A9P5PXY1_9AGAR|nr:hypothetical protein BDP27DRAFT_1419406 [Rhodocollybia butyracea]